MADPTRADTRQEIRDHAEQILAKEFTKRDRPRSKKPTKPYKEAAVNLGRVELWTWLSHLLNRAASQPREPAAPARNLAAAGPVAVEEAWDRLRSDSAFHTVLWISEWPRSQVYPGFLAPVLLATGVRRSFTLLCTPMRLDRAARDLRRKKTEYIADSAQRAKIGQIEDAQQTAEYHDVLQQEADLTAGHGILRFTGLIAVSAPTPDALDSAVAELEQAAVQASCETRRLVGQQAQAFTAASLPLCRGT